MKINIIIFINQQKILYIKINFPAKVFAYIHDSFESEDLLVRKPIKLFGSLG
jgi:hypothetical protein